MEALRTTDTGTILSGHADWIDAELLAALSEYPLESIDTEYPHFARSVERSDETVRPSDDHPIFYGSFDWHSAVHNHWCLVRQLRLFDNHPEQSTIVSTLDGRFTRERVEQEAAYFDDHESFEKPYGWAWFLQFVSELQLWESDRAATWRACFEPLEREIVERFERDVLTQDRPFRVGTHDNTAFALSIALDYAQIVGDDSLERSITDTSRAFYLGDRDYPAEYEPLGWDFLSPTLTEANLMRRVLDHGEFQRWFDAFTPEITDARYDDFRQPVDVDGDGDGLELHFVGLNLSKAWALADLADALDDETIATTFEQSARRHVDHSLTAAFTEDYAGAHWLSSFVLYLLTRNEGGIGPGR